MASGDKTSVVMAPASKEGNLPIFGENGQLADSGKKISDKADLEDGQVPYAQMNHLTAVKKLYVNATAGNDNNPGTQELPFKTIQAAIDSLPKDFGKLTATIHVEEGIYNEAVLISGFYGGEAYVPLLIKGSSTVDESRRVAAFRIANNSTVVQIDGFFVTGHIDLTSASIGVSSGCCKIYNTKIKCVEGKTVGVSAGGNAPAQVYVSGGEIDGYPTCGAEASYASTLALNGVKIKNCGVGVRAVYGVCMLNAITNEGNTSNTATIGNGQIFGGR